MAWSAPRDWVTGEIPTGSTFNTHLRDQLKYILGPDKPLCVLSRAAEQNMTGVGFEAIAWTVEVHDNAGMHATNSTQTVAPVTAWYHAMCAVEIDDAAGRSTLDIYFNGTSQITFDRRDAPTGGTDTTLRVSRRVLLTAGQYLETRMNVAASANIRVDGSGVRTPIFEVELLKFTT